MNFLDIQSGPILWTIVNFIILLVLLRAVAWKPILKALEMREGTINDALNRAEVAKSEAERILTANKEVMQKAEEESQRVLRESREHAERMQTEASAKAQAESRRMIEQAQQEIERGKQQALTELRTEVANLAVGAAEKILNESLDGDRQKRLVDTYLTQAVQTPN
ncbi:MAG: F0F1 ATP synthase subunit B [Bacteroidota bacterium]